MSEYNKWSQWYEFGDLFEYRGLVDETGETRRKKQKVKWKDFNGLNSTGFLHRDNGFRLRSFNYESGSFSNMPLKPSLADRPCPLNDGDLGVYWLRVETPNSNYNYIGLSGAEKTSIFKRLVDHFTKTAGTFGHSTGYEDTVKFKEFRDEMEKLGIDTDRRDFFENNVKIAFVKVKATKTVNVKVAKIEGMAIQAFNRLLKNYQLNPLILLESVR